MHFAGAAAPRFDDYNTQARPERATRPFSVYQGGGLDARVRRGISSSFVTYFALAAALIAAFVVLGCVRIGITSATVGCLRQATALEQGVEDQQIIRTELQAERSQLADTKRVERIATQNYGMVRASDGEIVHFGEAPSQEQLDQATEQDMSAAREAQRAADDQAQASAAQQKAQASQLAATSSTGQEAAPNESGTLLASEAYAGQSQQEAESQQPTDVEATSYSGYDEYASQAESLEQNYDELGYYSEDYNLYAE